MENMLQFQALFLDNIMDVISTQEQIVKEQY